MLGIEGQFRVRVINPDGTIDQDTGWCKNVVTWSGVEAILFNLAGGDSRVDGDPWAEALDANGYAAQVDKMALGTGGATGGGETGNPAYDSTDFDATELPAEGLPGYEYARAVCGANGAAAAVLGGWDTGAEAWDWQSGVEVVDRTVKSGVKFEAKWLAGFVRPEGRTINQIGLYSATGTYLIAGSYFAPITVSQSQQVDATYIISIAQAAAPAP